MAMEVAEVVAEVVLLGTTEQVVVLEVLQSNLLMFPQLLLLL